MKYFSYMCVFGLQLRSYHSYNYYNPFLSKAVEPSLLREQLYTYTNNNSKYIPYTRVKPIMHTELDMIDIYGDNTMEKNLEHVFPQFAFKNDPRKKEMKSDIHNLYLSNMKINSARQNFKYVTHDDYVSHTNEILIDTTGKRVHEPKEIFKKCGYLMLVNRKKQEFIPTKVSRGKIARSLAYFAVKYNYTEELKNVIDIKTLVEWNIKDPVSNEEYYKNVIAYKYQNNLNPFILNPELTMYCFADIEPIDEYIITKERKEYVDPMYTIERLTRKIHELEETNKYYVKILTKK